MISWRIGIAAFGMLSFCYSISVVADEPQPYPPAEAGGLPDLGDAPLVAPLALWPPCLSPERLERVKPICFGDDPRAGMKVANRFLLLLNSTEDDVETLCNVDTMIVRSLQECVISRPGAPGATGTASLLSGLINAMAQKWHQQGEFLRADDLYQHFFEGYDKSWLHEAKYGNYFKNWASVKLALGEWEAAKDLAGRYVVYSRALYDCDRNFLPSLVKSLEFQVGILESVRDVAQAVQAHAELERLAAIAGEHCSGDVCGGCIEGVCRGSPGFDGGCMRYFERME
jgi:hypothetical protein